MPKVQVLTGFVNIGGDRGNVAFRGNDAPMTYPEMLILRHIHGAEGSGDDHVYGLEEIDRRDINISEERLRLMQTYGTDAVNAVIPTSIPDAMFPLKDDKIATADDVAAASAAAAKVLAERKSKNKPGKLENTAVADPALASGLPSLDQLAAN